MSPKGYSNRSGRALTLQFVRASMVRMS